MDDRDNYARKMNYADRNDINRVGAPTPVYTGLSLEDLIRKSDAVLSLLVDVLVHSERIATGLYGVDPAYIQDSPKVNGAGSVVDAAFVDRINHNLDTAVDGLGVVLQRLGYVTNRMV